MSVQTTKYMVACKENGEKAQEVFADIVGRVIQQYVPKGVPLDPFIEQSVAWMHEFLQVATKKLPRMETIERDKERKKSKK